MKSQTKEALMASLKELIELVPQGMTRRQHLRYLEARYSSACKAVREAEGLEREYAHRAADHAGAALAWHRGELTEEGKRNFLSDRADQIITGRK